MNLNWLMLVLLVLILCAIVSIVFFLYMAALFMKALQQTNNNIETIKVIIEQHTKLHSHQSDINRKIRELIGVELPPTTKVDTLKH